MTENTAPRKTFWSENIGCNKKTKQVIDKKFNNFRFSSRFVELIELRDRKWTEHLTWITFKSNFAWMCKVNWTEWEQNQVVRSVSTEMTSLVIKTTTYLNFFIEYYIFCSRLVSGQLLLGTLFSQQRSHFIPIVVQLRFLMAPKHLSFPPLRVSLSLIPSWLLILSTIWGCRLLKATVQKTRLILFQMKETYTKSKRKERWSLGVGSH